MLFQVLIIVANQMNTTQKFKEHQSNRHLFSAVILLLQVIITILYGLFVKVKARSDGASHDLFYPLYQHLNVMMLLGFGFAMTYIKNHAWSALVYTFFTNAIVVQFYILISAFWKRVFEGNWGGKIQIEEKQFTRASYCVTCILVSFAGLLGKIGPLRLLIVALFGTIGYSLNQALVGTVIKAFDNGGSYTVHAFGAYYGLAISFILSRKSKPQNSAQTTYGNITNAMIGTLFLWVYWPSSNAAYSPEFDFQRSLIICNTILCLTASCLSTLAMSGILRKKFNMQDILNASLAGGVISGATSGVVANLGIILAIGLLAGIISTLGYVFLTEKIQKGFLGIHDTCGINNLHGIPGLLGGIISAMVIASYQSYPGLDQEYKPYLNFQKSGRTYSEQAGLQIAGTFISLGISILFGLFVGVLLYQSYNFKNEDFFDDSHYFQLPHENPRNVSGIIPIYESNPNMLNSQQIIQTKKE